MKKQKKQSIVLFEDWIKYARCLTDNEFRQFINAIFEYYEGVVPNFTGNLELVWEDCLPNLEENVTKFRAAQNRGKKLGKTNPKLNPTLKTIPNIGPGTGSNTGSSTIPDTILKIIPETGGMTDGRCEMGDDRWEINEKMIDGDKEMLDKEFIISQFSKGVSTSSLIEQYPHSQSLITEIYLDYDF